MNSGGKARWTDGTIPVVEPECLTSLIAATSDLAFVVSPEGKIASVLVEQRAQNHARLDAWADHPMQDFLTTESLPRFEDGLRAMAAMGELNRQIELNHKDGDVWRYPVRYSFHRIGRAGSILMLGTDLRHVAETQEQLVQAQIALERGYEQRREHDARYRVIMANTQDAFVFVAPDGSIHDLNPAAACLLGGEVDALVGASFAREFKQHPARGFVDNLMAGARQIPPSEVTVRSARASREIRITPSIFRAVGSSVLLCRLTPCDSEPVSEKRLDRDFEALFRKATDGIAICDTRGVVLEANDAFLDMTDLADATHAKNRSLGDFLQRGQVDLGVVLENTLRSGQMQFYATWLVNDLGTRTEVEISSIHLDGNEYSSIAFVIRDADRANIFRRPASQVPVATPSNRQLAELVGTASLKDIVAETTDLIERMCIETAIEKTQDNRAAAADLLGISRQSLYVKLRKHGMQDRAQDPD